MTFASVAITIAEELQIVETIQSVDIDSADLKIRVYNGNRRHLAPVTDDHADRASPPSPTTDMRVERAMTEHRTCTCTAASRREQT